MSETNLFGELISDEEAAVRPTSINRPKKTGYAAPPGTGTQGETCKTCQHLCRIHCAKTYMKCGLMRGVWTGGPGTDIKSRSPACSKWERSNGKVENVWKAH